MGTGKLKIARLCHRNRCALRRGVGRGRIALSIGGGTLDQNIYLTNLETCGLQIKIQIHFAEFLQLLSRVAACLFCGWATSKRPKLFSFGPLWFRDLKFCAFERWLTLT